MKNKQSVVNFVNAFTEFLERINRNMQKPLPTSNSSINSMNLTSNDNYNKNLQNIMKNLQELKEHNGLKRKRDD